MLNARVGGVVILSKVREDLIELVTRQYKSTKGRIPLIAPLTENQCGKFGFFC